MLSAQLNQYIRPLTVHEYQKMADFGIINENEHVELIEGKVIKMAPIGFVHSGIVDYLCDLLHDEIHKKAIVRVQSSVYLDKNYMPEPDIVLIKRREDFYKSRYVKAEDIFLIIEVSDSSFRYDSEIKIPSYAKFNIPEVWIIDVNTQRLIRYYQPANGVYEKIETLEELQTLSLMALPDVTLNLTHLF